MRRLRTGRGRGEARRSTAGTGRRALLASGAAGLGVAAAAFAAAFGPGLWRGVAGGAGAGGAAAFLAASSLRRLFKASIKSSSCPFGWGASGGAGTRLEFGTGL